MKRPRSFLAFGLVLVLLALSSPALAIHVRTGGCVTGGSDCVDGVDGSLLSAGDAFIVVQDVAGTPTSSIYRAYYYASSPPAANGTTIIAPVTNGTHIRWLLVVAPGGSGSGCTGNLCSVTASSNALSLLGDTYAQMLSAIGAQTAGSYALDGSVFHKATSAEFNALTLKPSLVSNDLLLLEDSAAGFAKKYTTVGDLLAAGGSCTGNLCAVTASPNGLTLLGDSFAQMLTALGAQPLLTNPVTYTGSITAGHKVTWNSVGVAQDGGVSATDNFSSNFPGVVCKDSSGNIVKCSLATDAAIPTPYGSNPAMDGTASAGSSANYARGDHVHPTDTSRAAEITSGALALATNSIASGACQTVTQGSVNSAAATGVATTDIIIFTPNASIKAVTGYAPSTNGGLTITAYPTAGYVNFDVCNGTASAITPGAVTLNWRVLR